MASDVYHPPAMPLYFDDLIADTTDLSCEELGAYVRMMHRQWTRGSIPDDNEAQVRITGLSAARMRKAREAIGKRLKPHPFEAKALYTKKMEEVRAEAKAYSDRQRARASKRWVQDRPLFDATAEPRDSHGIAAGDATAEPRDSHGIAAGMPTRAADIQSKRTHTSISQYNASLRSSDSLHSSDSLRSRALANCPNVEKAKKYVRVYTATLAAFRKRGATIAEAWDACEEAMAENNGPLFGGVRSALDFLGARSAGVGNTAPTEDLVERAKRNVALSRRPAV